MGTCSNRDNTETNLLNYAFKNSLPALGICANANDCIWAGVELKKSSGILEHDIGSQGALHVNSYHNYAIKEIPENFTALAYSEDGMIEAIKHKNLQWEGWMWHPNAKPIQCTRY